MDMYKKETDEAIRKIKDEGFVGKIIKEKLEMMIEEEINDYFQDKETIRWLREKIQTQMHLKRKNKICGEEGCYNEIAVKGRCKKCYAYFRYHNQPRKESLPKKELATQEEIDTAMGQFII